MKSIFKQMRTLPILLILLIAVIGSGCKEDKIQEIETWNLSLSVDQTVIKSDNLDSAFVTAKVVNQNNSAVRGLEILFEASSGQLSHSLVTTDKNGEALVSFSSGQTDKSNRIATITASAKKLDSKQIPVTISGTTLEISTERTKLEMDGENSARLTIFLKDGGDAPIDNVDVDVNIDSTSTGNVGMTPLQQTTDADGKLEFDLTGLSKGLVLLNLSALGASNAQKYVVGLKNEVFSIIVPSTSPIYLPVNSSSTVTVHVSDPEISEVVFSTTLGRWDGSDRSTITSSIVNDESLNKWVASAQLTSTKSGRAQIQVYAARDTSIKDKTEFVFPIYVPKEYPTIQSAIDVSTDGGIILVADGIYSGKGNIDIDFQGKAITLKSENGMRNCIIDCRHEGRGFIFNKGELKDSVVDGFTIKNGRTSSYGGGIYCVTSSPTIMNCLITKNRAAYDNNDNKGGGIYSGNNSYPRIINCAIIQNQSDYLGGGFYSDNSGAELINCTFSRNKAVDGGGVYSRSMPAPRLTNSILWQNIPNEVVTDTFTKTYSPLITNSIVQGGYRGKGNKNLDPQFINNSEYYHLSIGSPCINKGIAKIAPWSDIDRQKRVGKYVDIGADEYYAID